MMYCIIIDDIDLTDAPMKFAPSGYRWAATSNTGLPKGKWRLTFLPESAFVDDGEKLEPHDGPPRTNKPPRHVSEIIDELIGGDDAVH